MTMAGRGSAAPPIGAHVITSDGNEIGTVKEVQGSAFKVDAPMQQDFWLGDNCITNVAGDKIMLSFAKDKLGDYRMGSADELMQGQVDAIDLLMSMHREAKQQFTAILGASDGHRAEQMWKQLQPVLKVHEEMEEKYLYDPLRAQQGAGSELGAWEPQHEREVEQIESLISRADGMDAGSAGWRDQIRSIFDTLSEHISEEEGTIFPRIRQVWNEGQLRQAGQQMQRLRAQKLGPSMS